MDQRTKSYVREAVAFIYLINCESGGGYSEGRVSVELDFFRYASSSDIFIKDLE